jgi:hypothetical protein
VTKKNTGIYLLIASILLIFQAGSVVGQEIPADTVSATFDMPAEIISATSVMPVDTITEDIHSPRKAAIMSAILPGMGQAYNRKYWKIPLVYGGFAALGYYIRFNNKNYNISKNAYIDLTDDDPGTDSYLKLEQIKYYNLNNPSEVENLKRGLLRRQDYFRRNRDLLFILTLGFYGLNIIDASVDAHFFNWDISDDLTMKWQPTLDQYNNKNIFSLNCTINF